MHIHVYVCTQVCMYKSMYVCIYASMYVCTQVCMYVCTLVFVTESALVLIAALRGVIFLAISPLAWRAWTAVMKKTKQIQKHKYIYLPYKTINTCIYRCVFLFICILIKIITYLHTHLPLDNIEEVKR